MFQSPRKKKADFRDFKTNEIKSSDYQPVFFLSTGRTGTKFFTELLSHSKNVCVFHSPQPEFIEQGKIAYEAYQLLGQSDRDKTLNELISQIFVVGREELLFKTYLRNQRYMETNNRITFLAPAIKYYIPNAKFVHLHRHPGEFIRSGLRRGWYSGDLSHDKGRVEPTSNSSNFNEWNNFDSVEKIAWLWNETNQFINDFLAQLNQDDYFVFNFNELNREHVSQLLQFLDIDEIEDETIGRLLPQKVNEQKTGSIDEYLNWEEAEKEKVRRICQKLADEYNYLL